MSERITPGLADVPTQVDLVVIGLGITGVGVALDAVSRGLSVLAVDAHDLAFGTSRWSSKLVHGGLRYLANGQVGVAHESAVERGILMEVTAPHLAHALPMLMPLTSSVSTFQATLARSGILAGDLLRRAAHTSPDTLPRPRKVSATEALSLAPGLRRHGLRGALLSWDGQLEDDARLGTALRSPEGLRQGDVVSSPVYFTGDHGRERAGTALIAYEPAASAAALNALQKDSLSRVALVALPGLALGVLLSFVLGRALVGPIRRLADGAKLVGAGKLDTRIPQAGDDELGELARDFNAMAAKLAELDELKDSFLAQITHDLRNPLTALVAYVNLLHMGVQGELNEKQKKSVKVIQESSLYLNELIGDILDLTKLEAGKMELAPKLLDAHAATRAVLELVEARAAEYGVGLECAVPEGAQVTADPDGLKRVLINLVSNALKFTPKGGRVTVSLASANGHDRVSVSDTGIGIPADKLGSLFQKFSQVAETKNKVRETQGTGLGLVICKQIVEAHGGTIGVESVYQKGTTFFFSLPRALKAG